MLSRDRKDSNMAWLGHPGRTRFFPACTRHVICLWLCLLSGTPTKAQPIPQVGLADAPQEKTSLVESVRDLGVQFEKNPLNITGQDAASSIPLASGQMLWLFGDTLEGTVQSIRNHELSDVLSNTACLVPKQDVSQGIRRFEYLTDRTGKRARQLVLFAADEDRSKHRLWAVHGIEIADEVYVYYHKITMIPGTSVFESFEMNGMGIARARAGEFQFERLVAPDGSREFWKGDVPTFGVFVEKLDDGLIYLWGSLKSGMFLARTRPETLAHVASYEYLVEAPTLQEPHRAARWAKEFAPTAVMFDGVPNEMSASFNRYLGRHVAIYVDYPMQQLALRTAENIFGPWSAPEYFFTPTKSDEWTSFYAGKEHPELAADEGRVLYVTFVSSFVYKPHLLEVRLKKRDAIDSATKLK